MSVGEVKATIIQGLRSAEHSLKTVEAVKTRATEVTAIATQTLHDSRHEEVEKGLACLRAAAHELELTGRHLKRTIDSASAYLSAL